MSPFVVIYANSTVLNFYFGHIHVAKNKKHYDNNNHHLPHRI